MQQKYDHTVSRDIDGGPPRVYPDFKRLMGARAAAPSKTRRNFQPIDVEVWVPQ
jgi:hypothetical protein